MSITTHRPGFQVTYVEDLPDLQALHPNPGITLTPLEWTAPHADTPRPIRLIAQFEPGAAVAEPDRHVDSQKITTVILGVLEDEGGTYGPGTQIRADRGTEHSPRSTTGCLAVVEYPDRRHQADPTPPVTPRAIGDGPR